MDLGSEIGPGLRLVMSKEGQACKKIEWAQPTICDLGVFPSTALKSGFLKSQSYCRSFFYQQEHFSVPGLRAVNRANNDIKTFYLMQLFYEFGTICQK